MKDIGSLDLGGNFHGSLFGMILDAGLMVKFVLLLLLIFSVVSWAIIFLKYRYYRKIKKDNERIGRKSNLTKSIHPIAALRLIFSLSK